MRSNHDGKQIALIVVADEPALLFSSIQVAEEYLEAIDVREGTYPEAYGPEGEPFEVTADRFDNVLIIERSACLPQPGRLHEILEDFLRARGIHFATNLELKDLIELCAPYVDDGL
jgi:hypothetical protein